MPTRPSSTRCRADATGSPRSTDRSERASPHATLQGRDSGTIIEILSTTPRVAGDGTQHPEFEIVFECQVDIVVLGLEIRVRQCDRGQADVGRIDQVFRVRRPEVAGRTVVGHTLCHDGEAQVVGHVGLQGSSQPPEIALGKPPVVDRISDVAIALRSDEGEPNGGVLHREIDMTLSACRCKASVDTFDVRAEVVLRRPRDEIDRTAGRVTPIQGSLRPLEYLDAFEIETPGNGQVGTSKIDTVQMQRYRLVAASLSSHAAQREASAEQSNVIDDETRNVELQVVQTGEVRLIQKISGQCLDAHRNVLKVFVDLACSDDDFGQARVVGCCLGRSSTERRCWQPGRADEDSRE